MKYNHCQTFDFKYTMESNTFIILQYCLMNFQNKYSSFKLFYAYAVLPVRKCTTILVIPYIQTYFIRQPLKQITIQYYNTGYRNSHLLYDSPNLERLVISSLLSTVNGWLAVTSAPMKNEIYTSINLPNKLLLL